MRYIRVPPMRILGVDPGRGGAMAIIDSDTKELIHITDVKSKNEFINYPKILTTLKEHKIDIAYIERVHSMPSDGVASAFAFGKATGVMLGAIVACDIPLREISPQEWQKCLGLGGRYATRTARKQAHLKEAVRKFPGTKIHLYKADAVLIALYGAHQVNTGEHFKGATLNKILDYRNEL